MAKMAMEWKTYIFHCTKCHHEWESAFSVEPQVCDWCKADGKLLEKENYGKGNSQNVG